MKVINRRYARCFSSSLLAGAFLMSSEMPLLASPTQSSQSTAGQRHEDLWPDAPQSQSLQTPASHEPAPAPSGAAGAKAPKVKGSPVAQPAGAAVAPARQRGHRSFLIKLGLLAGAGIAVGSAVALSKGSPSRPPGVSATTHP
jgi:hypothetical protein